MGEPCAGIRYILFGDRLCRVSCFVRSQIHSKLCFRLPPFYLEVLRLVYGSILRCRFALLDIMNKSIGFITFYLYLLLSSLSADFTMIVQHYSCLYCLSYFVFIHAYIIQIRGTNWGIRGGNEKGGQNAAPTAITRFSDCPFPFVWYSVKHGCINP